MQTDPANTHHLAENFDGFLSGKALKSVHGDRFIRINMSRNTLIAIVFSLLLHALILFVALPKIQLDNASATLPRAMEVSLSPPKPAATVIEQTPVEEPIEPTKEPIARVDKPAIAKPRIMAQKPTPKIIKSEKPSFTVPVELVKPQPALNPQLAKEPVLKELQPEDFPDMQSYVKAMQARRNASETNAAQQNAEAVARERGPSEEQVRDERIKRNFQTGTNGIFEITSLSSRNATFAFRGWTSDYSSSKRQFFEVEAKSGQDVRLVMIKRMIALIREHYQGDFNWESHRLGRSVVQSARPEDNAGLEDFMMMEFFGSNYKSSP
ncbi:MAG: hypothetical protein A3I83_02930 [Methylotenera sp. RIFCSPLOWO2_02_FULL_45_14]|nr:MAG: hypothetical protein A3I83_02930 [Methylotenera sp. RIFCSPLOWO2_02_FULL_45_14]